MCFLPGMPLTRWHGERRRKGLWEKPADLSGDRSIAERETSGSSRGRRCCQNPPETTSVPEPPANAHTYMHARMHTSPLTARKDAEAFSKRPARIAYLTAARTLASVAMSAFLNTHTHLHMDGFYLCVPLREPRNKFKTCTRVLKRERNWSDGQEWSMG